MIGAEHVGTRSAIANTKNKFFFTPKIIYLNFTPLSYSIPNFDQLATGSLGPSLWA